MKALALTLALLLTPACAGILPAIVAAVAIASEVASVIEAISDFVTPQLKPEDRALVEQAITRARFAVAALQHAARAGEAVDAKDLAAARSELRAAVEALFEATRPYGVQQAKPGGLYSAQPGVLVVRDLEGLVGE